VRGCNGVDVGVIVGGGAVGVEVAVGTDVGVLVGEEVGIGVKVLVGVVVGVDDGIGRSVGVGEGCVSWAWALPLQAVNNAAITRIQLYPDTIRHRVITNLFFSSRWVALRRLYNLLLTLVQKDSFGIFARTEPGDHPKPHPTSVAFARL